MRCDLFNSEKCRLFTAKTVYTWGKRWRAQEIKHCCWVEWWLFVLRKLYIKYWILEFFHWYVWHDLTDCWSVLLPQRVSAPDIILSPYFLNMINCVMACKKCVRVHPSMCCGPAPDAVIYYTAWRDLYFHEVTRVTWQSGIAHCSLWPCWR